MPRRRRGLENGIAAGFNALFGTSGQAGFNRGFRNEAAGQNSIASAMRNRASANETNQNVMDRQKGLEFLDNLGEQNPTKAELAAFIRSATSSNPANMSVASQNLQNQDVQNTVLNKLGLQTNSGPTREDFAEATSMGLDPNNPADMKALAQIREENSRAPGFNNLPHASKGENFGSQGGEPDLNKLSMILQAAGGKGLEQFKSSANGNFRPATGDFADPSLFNAKVNSENALGDERSAGALLDNTKAGQVVPESEAKISKTMAETLKAQAGTDKIRKEIDQLDDKGKKVLAEIEKIRSQTKVNKEGAPLTKTAKQGNFVQVVKLLGDPDKPVQLKDGRFAHELNVTERAQAAIELIEIAESQGNGQGILSQEPPPKVEEPGLFDSIFGGDEPEPQAVPQGPVAIPGVGQMDISAFEANLPNIANEDLAEFAETVLPQAPPLVQKLLMEKIQAELNRRQGG